MSESSLENTIPKTAIVIGAGIAGLAVAIRLAAKGFHVTVFEQNSYPGGKISLIQQDGYTFDAGPSLFTQPDYIRELFDVAGEPMENYFSYKQVPVSCKYFFENGKQLTAFADTEKFAKEMEEALGEDPAAVKKYLDESKNAFKHIGEYFLHHPIGNLFPVLNKKLFSALASCRLNYVTKSLHEYNSSKFRTAESVQLFDRFATYNGSNPYKAPAMLSMIPHLEINLGTFYPEGGMISITNALYQLAQKKGVRFLCDTKVDRIINHEGIAGGVVANRKNYYADVVVSDADIYFTYKYLLNDESNAQKILKRQRSSSAFIFYWGIAKIFEELQLHNIFFSHNYKAEFEHIFEKKALYKDPTIYINITSKMEASHAPEGCENWFVMVNAPATAGQYHKEQQSTLRKNILAKLSRMLNTELEALIASESVMDPAGIEKTSGSYMGSLYGASSNSISSAFARHANTSKTIKGLYFVGGSVHPGGGIPLCLSGARIVSEMIKA